MQLLLFYVQNRYTNHIHKNTRVWSFSLWISHFPDWLQFKPRFSSFLCKNPSSPDSKLEACAEYSTTKKYRKQIFPAADPRVIKAQSSLHRLFSCIYRSVRLCPKMDNPNSWIVRSPMEIVLLALVCKSACLFFWFCLLGSSRTLLYLFVFTVTGTTHRVRTVIVGPEGLQPMLHWHCFKTHQVFCKAFTFTGTVCLVG